MYCTSMKTSVGSRTHVKKLGMVKHACDLSRRGKSKSLGLTGLAYLMGTRLLRDLVSKIR